MLRLAIAKKELKNGYHHFVVFDGDKVKKCNTLFKGKLNSRFELLKLCNTHSPLLRSFDINGYLWYNISIRVREVRTS